MPRLNAEVSDTDSGITIRGKRILRSIASRATRQLTRVSRRLGEVGPEHDAGEQVHAVVRYALAPMWRIWVKNRYRTPKNSSGRISDQK